MITPEKFLKLIKEDDEDIFKMGVINSIKPDGKATIKFDGEATPSEKSYLSVNYSPIPDDRVLLIKLKGTYLIVGAVGGEEKGLLIGSHREKLVNTNHIIDLDLGNTFNVTISANTTFVFNNAKNEAHSFTLIINMGAVRTLNFPASVRWADGDKPDMTEANKRYILTFISIDSGEIWNGMIAGVFDVS